MIEFEVAVDIDAPVDEVFGYSANNENDAEWMGTVTKVEKTSEGPTGVGSTFVNYVHFMGKTFDDSHEVVEYQPNERMRIVQRTGPVPFTTTYLYKPTNGGTRFSLLIEAETKGLFRMAKPVMARQLKKQFENDLQTLKALLEQRRAT
jgi:uncharacterized protein YndB with AHSA1/START domain